MMSEWKSKPSIDGHWWMFHEGTVKPVRVRGSFSERDPITIFQETGGTIIGVPEDSLWKIMTIPEKPEDIPAKPSSELVWSRWIHKPSRVGAWCSAVGASVLVWPDKNEPKIWGFGDFIENWEGNEEKIEVAGHLRHLPSDKGGK